MKKTCNKCCVEKDLSEFHKNKDKKDGLQSECKDCMRNRLEVYRNQNKVKVKEYYQNNLEKFRAHQNDYYNNHKEEIKIYKNNRLKTDPIYKLKHNIRGLIGNSFKRQGYTKSSRTYNILGCTHQEFQNHLFSNAIERYPDFTPSDYLTTNKYHIDHIKPLALAKTIEEVIELCHYTNLQILTAEENMTKADSYES